jgi:ABC-type multidrug transport system permease subunit
VAVARAAGWLVPPPGRWPALLALLGAVTLAAVGLGVALGAVAGGSRYGASRVVAMLGLNVSAYLFFLGGGFATVAFLPPWLEGASRWVPTRYAIDGVRQVLFYEDTIDLERDLVVLVATAVASVALAAFALGRPWGRA